MVDAVGFVWGGSELKVEITIRCNRCDALETVLTEAWALPETSCGCNGPYRIVERKEIPEEPAPAAAETKDAPAGSEESTAAEQTD